MRDRVTAIINTLRKGTKGMVQPAVTQIISEYGGNPFYVLVSCLLSLRTKDTVSLPASRRLLDLVKTPEDLLVLPREKLEKTVFPVGFYRQKARTLHEVAKRLINDFDSRVPNTEEELLSIKGVGRKTANLVLAEGFGIPALCVDTHVHRISNRLGLAKTSTPQQTEDQLKHLLPRKNWIEFNPLLVMWGQNICTPISPFCSRCPLAGRCPKIGVKKSR